MAKKTKVTVTIVKTSEGSAAAVTRVKDDVPTHEPCTMAEATGLIKQFSLSQKSRVKSDDGKQTKYTYA